MTPAVHYLRFGFTEAQVAAFGDAAEVALVATHPAYEARTVLPPASAGRAARRPAGHNKGPTYRLTRDNSVRKSLQALEDLSHTLRSPKFGNGAIGRCIERASEQGECKYPPTYPLNEEVFPMIATTWRKLAACRGLDVEAFYPVTEDEADAAEAKAVCAVCPVRQACLEHALAHREREGIWGGTTERERRRIVRQRRKSA